MTLKQVCNINNNQLIINLPKKFYGRKKVMVILEDIDELVADKFLLMKKAATDLLFLQDINEVNEDFDFVDSEL
jgi:hypothetical protein